MKEPLDIATDERGVRTLTLNRPDKGNALDGELVDQLREAIAEARADAKLRVLVLTGAGKAFSGGADLYWMRQMAQASLTDNQVDAFELARLLEELSSLPKPVLARVNGSAWGGAIGLIAACDIAIASAGASFTFSEVHLGLVPAVIAPYIAAIMGPRQARRWFLTGESFDAVTARQLGLVHKQVAAEALDETVAKEVSHLLMGAPHAQSEIKELMSRWLGTSPVRSEEAANLLARVRASSEGMEGMIAFIEKRKPGWLR